RVPPMSLALPVSELLRGITYNYAALSGIRDCKASKDGQQPCFTSKGRCHLSLSLMAVTVSLSRSWKDLYRHRPLFILFYHAICLKILRLLHLGRTAVVGDFPCLVGVPHCSGRRTPVYPAFCGNIFLMAGT